MEKHCYKMIEGELEELMTRLNKKNKAPLKNGVFLFGLVLSRAKHKVPFIARCLHCEAPSKSEGRRSGKLLPVLSCIEWIREIWNIAQTLSGFPEFEFVEH